MGGDLLFAVKEVLAGRRFCPSHEVGDPGALPGSEL